MKQIHQIPIFEALADSQNILLAGAGGGFDIFSGIPLYFNLTQQGKKVTIANFSFTWLDQTTAKCVFPYYIYSLCKKNKVSLYPFGD